MTTDRFSGDPRLLFGPAGWTLDYEGGQPVMDQGLENQALLSLLTRPGWCGNVFLPKADQIGSDFREVASNPVTLQGLADVQNAAERALGSGLFPRVKVEVTNPQSWDVRVVITLGRGTLTLDRRGMLWSAQAGDPASGRLVKTV